MRWLRVLVAVLSLVAVVGCATSQTGRIVTPEYLARFEGGGSLRTVWYYGSDEQFHYFSVLHKNSTPYRIKKAELKWDREFPYGSRQEATLVTNELSTYVREQAERQPLPNSPIEPE